MFSKKKKKKFLHDPYEPKLASGYTPMNKLTSLIHFFFFKWPVEKNEWNVAESAPRDWLIWEILFNKADVSR